MRYFHLLETADMEEQVKNLNEYSKCMIRVGKRFRKSMPTIRTCTLGVNGLFIR